MGGAAPAPEEVRQCQEYKGMEAREGKAPPEVLVFQRVDKTAFFH